MGTGRVAAVRRVRLRVADDELARLSARIRECAAHGQLGAGVVPHEFVDDFLEYWVERYDWRAQEHRLNTYQHFATEVDGQFVHFVQVRAADPDARAVLLTHVWPSGFMDALEAAGSFQGTHNLVIPSIAWTALSGGWDELMGRLGYDDYLVRDDLGRVPPAPAPITGERRGLAPEEIAEVRWFSENLTAINAEQQLHALVLSAAMLARNADWDAVLTGVMLAWFLPRLQAE